MKKIVVYTDGACSGNPGPGGFGAVIIYGDIRRELSGGFRNTTNNRMEILAVIKALEILNQPCEVDLYSDSRYVVDAIKKNWLVNWQKKNWCRTGAKKVLNVDLWQKLSVLLSIHNVNFIWVKGHNDNKENERCDFLARQAIGSGALDIDYGYMNSAV